MRKEAVSPPAPTEIVGLELTVIEAPRPPLAVVPTLAAPAAFSRVRELREIREVMRRIFKSGQQPVSDRATSELLVAHQENRPLARLATAPL